MPSAFLSHLEAMKPLIHNEDLFLISHLGPECLAVASIISDFLFTLAKTQSPV